MQKSNKKSISWKERKLLKKGGKSAHETFLCNLHVKIWLKTLIKAKLQRLKIKFAFQVYFIWTKIVTFLSFLYLVHLMEDVAPALIPATRKQE